MKVEWFCQVMGSEVGPLSQSQLVDMVRQQKITPEDLVKRNNSSWVAAFEVKGLFAAAAKAPKTRPRGGSSNASEKPKEVKPRPVSMASQQPSQDSRVPTESALSSRENGGCDSDWYCIASGEKQGPIHFAELQALMREGRLRQTDRVWRSSSPKFRKASEVDELRMG